KKRIQRIEDADLFTGLDLILDGLDSISSRYLLMEIAIKKGLPLIHGAIGAFEAQLAFLEPDINRMKVIYPWEEEVSKANLSFVPSFLASLQVKMLLEYFLSRPELEKNTLIRIDLRDLQIYKIPLDT
ncbi:MAG TPA: ThiF family adenylyltransferase, partial [Clostridia bacterium]|nr:ThiF family adenylyltransferase [Clostridia bacterium]